MDIFIHTNIHKYKHTLIHIYKHINTHKHGQDEMFEKVVHHNIDEALNAIFQTTIKSGSIR